MVSKVKVCAKGCHDVDVDVDVDVGSGEVEVALRTY